MIGILNIFWFFTVKLTMHTFTQDEMDLLEKMVYQEEVENQDLLDQLPSKESTSSRDIVKQLLYLTVHLE